MPIGFYVTAIRGKRVALALVLAVRVDACRIDPWCDFDQFGTARLERAVLPQGRLESQGT